MVSAACLENAILFPGVLVIHEVVCILLSYSICTERGVSEEAVAQPVTTRSARPKNKPAICDPNIALNGTCKHCYTYGCEELHLW